MHCPSASSACRSAAANAESVELEARATLPQTWKVDFLQASVSRSRPLEVAERASLSTVTVTRSTEVSLG
eukprot:2674425-Rhodomonas_salina.1